MKVLAFDANSIVNRAFYGVRLLSTREGTYTKPAADHGPHRHVAAGGGRLERQGE